MAQNDDEGRTEDSPPEDEDEELTAGLAAQNHPGPRVGDLLGRQQDIFLAFIAAATGVIAVLK
jgi:hypothetical protein